MKKKHLLMFKQWANKRNENTAQIEILHQGDFNWFLSDCVMNVLSGIVPINKVELKKFEKPLRKLADRRVEKSERIKIFRSDSRVRLIKMIALLFWSKMNTEEFVLIPRQMYANEQPQIAQLLINKIVRERAKQISLLQRSKSPTAPSTTQQDTQQQTDNILKNIRDELNETRDDKIDTKISTKSGSEFWEILNTLIEKSLKKRA